MQDTSRIEAALRNAHNARDTQAAQRLAQHLRSIREPQDAPAGNSGRINSTKKIRNMSPDEKAAFKQNQSTAVNSAIMGAQQGLSLNFADEAEARIKAIGSSSYDDELAKTRSRYDAAETANPNAFMAGNIVGGVATSVVPGAAALRIGRGAGMLGKSLAVSGSEGVVGGLAGYGANEKPEELSGDIVTGATVGATLGGGVPIVAKQAGVAGSALRQLMSGRSRPSRRIIEAAKISGKTPEQLREISQKLGNEGMLADVTPEHRELANYLANDDTPARPLVRKALNDRAEGRLERSTGAYDEAMGGTQNTADYLDNLINTKRQNAAPLYEKAYAQPIQMTENMQSVMNRLDNDGVLKEAESLAQLEGKSIYTPDGGLTVQGADYIQRGLDDRVAASTNIQGAVTNKGRLYGNLKRQFVSDVEAQNPDFAAARKQFRGDQSVQDAFELGQDILKRNQNKDQFAKQLSSISEAERDAMRVGVRSSIDDAIGQVKNGAMKAENILVPNNRAKIEAVLGKEEASTLFNRMDAEATMNATRNKAVGNSETANRANSPYRKADKSALGNLLRVNIGDAADSAYSFARAPIRNRGAVRDATALTAQGSQRDKIVEQIIQSLSGGATSETQGQIAQRLLQGGVGGVRQYNLSP